MPYTPHPSQFVLPRELTDVLMPWLLVGPLFVKPGQNLFGTLSWDAFNASTYCMYYVDLVQRIHHRISGRYVHVNPQKTRHIFVEWLRDQVDPAS